MNLARAGGLLIGLALLTATTSAEELKWRPSQPRAGATPPPPALPAVFDSATPTSESSVAPAGFQFPIPKLRGRSNETLRPTTEGPVLSPGTIQTSEPTLIKTMPAQLPVIKDSSSVVGTQPERIKTMPAKELPVIKDSGDIALPQPEVIKTMPQKVTPDGEVVIVDGIPCDDCEGCGRWWGTWCRGFWNRCDDCGDCGMDCCFPRPAFWASAEYLRYALRKPAVPPLVANVAFPTPPGALTRPATTILFDDDQWENPWRNGGRLRAGYWFERTCCWGVDVSGFMLERMRANYFAASSGIPTLGRPLVRADLGFLQDTQLVAFPGIVAGSINIDYSNFLWGAEANLRRKLWCNDVAHVDAQLGYRYIRFEENVRIREDLVTLTAPTVGFRINDNFDVTNNFHGVNLGLDGEYHFADRWFIGGQVKLGLGFNYQTVNLTGGQVITPPPPAAPVVAPFGVFVLATNAGRSTQTRFAFVPETNLKLGYELTENLRVWVGYDLLYISNVVRAPEQIDLAVNRNNVPTFAVPAPVPVAPFRPAVLFQTTDFWAQGANVGLEYRY